MMAIKLESEVYLWEDKITILYNVQDGYSDITLDDIKKEDPKTNFDESSLLGRLVEATGVEPVSKKLFMAVSTSLVYLQHSLIPKPTNRPDNR